jgi:hypothetical protein
MPTDWPSRKSICSTAETRNRRRMKSSLGGAPVGIALVGRTARMRTGIAPMDGTLVTSRTLSATSD